MYRNFHHMWGIYECSVCFGLVTAAAHNADPEKTMWEHYPETENVSEFIPGRARECLKQAQESLAQPIGSVMLSATSVDAMLKDKGLRDGSLYERIELAAQQGLITTDMAKWAHQVRLDANDQRHVDDTAPPPSVDDARRSFDFAMAFAEILHVLPARVTRGIKEAQGKR
jgi:hypothetical protein